MILFLDNYDSFTYNLVEYFSKLGYECEVVRNNIAPRKLNISKYSHLVIGPGPGTPMSSGFLMEYLQYFEGKLPILGICLGMQAIGVHYGYTLQKAPYPMHGKVSLVAHNEEGLFKEIHNPTEVCRYHSLVIAKKSEGALNFTATSLDDSQVMAVKHKQLPIYGLQFHPEAILTQEGLAMLANFINLTTG